MAMSFIKQSMLWRTEMNHFQIVVKSYRFCDHPRGRWHVTFNSSIFAILKRQTCAYQTSERAPCKWLKRMPTINYVGRRRIRSG
eukprot:6057316-Prymnesium_polylepis.2